MSATDDKPPQDKTSSTKPNPTDHLPPSLSWAAEASRMIPAPHYSQYQPPSMDKIDICRQASDAVFAQLAQSSKGLRQICGEMGLSLDAWNKLMMKDNELYQAYLRARECQSTAIVDEIVEIADTDPDWGRARNRIEARKWVAGKWHRAQFGDRTEISGTGPGGAFLLSTCIPEPDPDPDTQDAELIEHSKA